MTTEEIIAVAEGVGLHYYVNEMAGSYVERLERFAAVVASIEREACAKVCEQIEPLCYDTAGYTHCAAAIRARGNI
jgi:hypothetical protein